MRNRFIVALTAALFSVAVMGGIVLATPSSGVTSTTIATGTLGPINVLVKTGSWMTQLRTKGESTLTVVENDERVALLDRVAFADQFVLAEEDESDVVLFKVEHHARDAVWAFD